MLQNPIHLRLEKLESWQHVTFMACLCERMYPNYAAFCKQTAAHAAFGGYKQSGIGRETHKMMLEHYQQTKCLLVSYSDKPLGLF